MIEAKITYVCVGERYPEFQYKDAVCSTFYASFYRVATFGSGSGVSEIYYLSQKGVEAGHATGICLLKYAIHRLVLLVFCAAFIVANHSFCRPYFGRYAGYLTTGYLFLCCVSIFILSICLSERLSAQCIRLMGWLKSKYTKTEKILEKLEKQLTAMQMESKTLVQNYRVMVRIIILNCLKFTVLYSIPYVIFHTATMNLGNEIAITSLAVVLAGVIPAPAGIGSIEFVFVSLYSQLITEVKALSTVVVYRFASFIFPFLIGGLGILVGKFIRSHERMTSHTR